MHSELRHAAAGAALVAVGCMSRVAPNVRFGATTDMSAITAVGTAPMFTVSPSGAQAGAWVSAPDSGTDGRLYVSVNGGMSREVRDSIGPIDAHGEAPPQLAYAPDGSLYSVYTVGKLVAGRRFPLSALRLVRSTDGGITWTPPVTVTDGPAFGAHSFEALHLASDGSMYVAWLGAPEQTADTTRTTVPSAAPHAAFARGAMPSMSHTASAAWITRSIDGGRSWSPRVRVDLGEACPCCRTALASGRDGTLYMGWRHIYAGNVRDIVVARSADNGASWSTPVRVHADDWHFDACPHAGPAIAVDSAGVLHVAWWTGKDGAAGAYYAHSTDGGRHFGAPIALGAAPYSRPAHVRLSVTGGHRVVVAWDDGTRQVPQIVVRVSADGGATFGPRVAVSDPQRVAGYPALGVIGDSLVIVWSERSVADAAEALKAQPNMKMSGATMGLDAVGASHVLARHGVIE